MKVVIAPDSFKESLSAIEVANAIEEGFQTRLGDDAGITGALLLAFQSLQES